MNEIRINGWVAVGDTEIVGRVTAYNDDEVMLARPKDPDRSWRIPIELARPIEHPLVETAAFQITDILREFDPSWGVVDTAAIRRRVVLQVLAAVGWHPDDVAQPADGVRR